MKTATTPTAKPIAATSARTPHTRPLWQRSLMLIALLVTCVLGVKAEKYVIYYQGGDGTKYYMANVSNTLTVLTVLPGEKIDAATCVWVGTSGNTFSNNGKSICFEVGFGTAVSLTGTVRSLTIDATNKYLSYNNMWGNKYYIYYQNGGFYSSPSNTDYGTTRVIVDTPPAGSDNTALEEAKNSAKTTLESKTPGAAVCQYTYTINGQHATDASLIETAIDNATTIEEINIIIASASINKPTPGKYYRIKSYTSQNYLDGVNCYNGTERMGLKSIAERSEQGSIFYLDGDYCLQNLETGTYTYNTHDIGANKENAESWTFTESTRTPGCLTLRSSYSGSKELHDNGGNRADRCSSICGAEHDFVLEEVVIIDTAEELAAITGSGVYIVTADITVSSHISISNFTGTFDGQHHTISGLTAPLFATTSGATIKNVVLDSLNITGGTGNVGAIVGTASGATRIYNCGVLSGSIGGGTNVGSIAGLIEGTARVINCYSFADITGGTTVGGIVGYNSVASTASNLKTLVMNCMYYGDITGGDNKAPIYNGKIISNAGPTGINNYNYYRYESNYSKSDDIDTYHCALAAEERYLTRHEFYRNILNSQRKLCAFYVTNSISNKDEIGKWVIDKTIAPYPIIKPWGKYPSTINKEVKDEKILGSLSVTIRGESATPQTNLTRKEITLDITDMDADNHDYNYYKVQLPYYNDYYSDNYTKNRVVTGWKITEVEGDNTVKYTEFKTTGNNAYNYADRYCIDKDLYSKTGIVFAQGGYYNVPEGVRSITIEPYWGKAVYLSDANYDEVYSTGYAGTHYAPAGTTPNTFKEQTVHKSLGYVWDELTGNTVYDNAIVLVGNYHSYNENWDTDNKPFTIMSVDEDGDNEPDYCLYHHFADRKSINPARFDFLYIPALAMAAKVTGSGMKMPNQGIYHPKGWLEITETSLIRFTEFEYDNGKTISSPIILNNGLFEQFVSSFGNNATNTNYIRLGGNIYFESYTPGTHTDKTNSTKRSPLTITGGEYKALYLSGEKATANTQQGDALCYSNGGYIHTFASAYMENINGNVTIKMDHSIIEEFYGGGLKESTTAQIAGNINVTINNSVVDFYCGGPKFGRVAKDKIITTNATGTTFGEFYGAGYGGTSYTIIKQPGNNGGDPQGTTYAKDQLYPKYTFKTKTDDGILVNYHIDFFTYAGGLGNLVSRFFNHYAKLSLAQTNNVTSTLVNCTVEQDFYGGGCLGAVEGDVTSTLTNCNIMGSAFAGGFSASIPTSMVRKAVPVSVPTYNQNSGVFNKDVLPAYEEYSWSSEVTEVDDNRKLLPTSQETLNNLGKVTGETKITINGNSQIQGSVFGGGNASKVIGNTKVHIQDGTVEGSVFGAGNRAEVTGKTEVIIGK